MTAYLKSVYDSRKSFYNKAIVEENEKEIVLYSYNTKVAVIDKASNHCKIAGTYSNTTLRHIKEFLLQNRFPCGSKREIEKCICDK